MSALLKLGLIINPLAGIGGPHGRKGSDGESLRQLHRQLPEEERDRAQQRVRRALEILLQESGTIRFHTWGGEMGERLLQVMGLEAVVLGRSDAAQSVPQDTRRAAQALLEAEVDLLLFAGGDGTARDVLDVVADGLPVLGIPAGVKMHSGVFAVSPEAAGELLRRLVQGGLVNLRRAEVRDIDEEAFRQDVVRSRFYGEMLVPAESHFLQRTKVGGKEDPELAAADIASWVVERMQPATTYLLGPGSTTAAIADELGIKGTLLGVDVVRDGELLSVDADESTLLHALEQCHAGAEIIVTAIGGQGHVFGRGNQQFSPAVIRAVGVDNVRIVAAKSKIAALQGRPLLVDTNDAELDRALRGYRPVTTGYEDQILYRVGEPWDA